MLSQEQANEKILVLMNQRKTFVLSEEEKKLFKELIYICDLNIQDKHLWNPVMFLLYKNSILNFSKEEIYQFLQKVDINQQNKDGFTAIMFLFYFNKEAKINLSTNHIFELVKKANLNIKNNMGESVLNILIKKNDTSEINFDWKKINKLLEKININDFINQEGYTLYALLLMNNKKEKIHLPTWGLRKKWKELNYKNKYETIKMIGILDEKVTDVISFLVFDIHVNTHKNLQKLFIKNNKNIFLKNIRKRDLMLELSNNKFKEKIKKI